MSFIRFQTMRLKSSFPRYSKCEEGHYWRKLSLHQIVINVALGFRNEEEFPVISLLQLTVLLQRNKLARHQFDQSLNNQSA